MSNTPTPQSTPNPSLVIARKYWPFVLIALLLFFPNHAERIKGIVVPILDENRRVIPVEETVEKITVETTTKPAKLVEPPEPKPAEAAAITPEDFAQWADLIRKLIEELKPKPTPVDPLPVDPKPVDPPPQPPLPTDSRIVITDETGKPVTAATVDAGALFLATAPGGQSVAWQVSKHGSVRIATLPANAGFAFSLDAGSFVELFLTDYGAKTQTSIRITCNSGHRHPPNVVPDVEPLPPIGRKLLSLAVLYEPKRISPSTAIVLNATDSWNGFITAGHEWQFYDRASPEPLAKQAVTDSGTATLPTLVIYEKTTRAKLGVIPLPTSVDELKAVVRMYEGGAK